MVNNKIGNLVSYIFNIDVIVTLTLSLLWPSLGLLFVSFKVLTCSESSEKQMLALIVGLTFFFFHISILQKLHLVILSIILLGIPILIGHIPFPVFFFIEETIPLMSRYLQLFQ